MKEFTLEDTASSIGWREFENLVSEIFISHSFSVRKNFRFKANRRHEIDLLATRRDMVLCVDCKQWKGGRNKKTALAKAVREQELRLKELSIFLASDDKSATELGIDASNSLHTMIVTLLQEEIVKDGETFVVPVWKLNSFLLDFESNF